MAWGCAANAGGWLPAQTDVMSWCPVNGTSSPKLYCDYYIDDRNIGTPLTDKGYVDWNKMLVLLKQKNLL